MSRYPQLQNARIKLIEAARFNDVFVEWLTRWFDDLERVIIEYEIQPENLYNMNESDFAIDDIEAS